jgi:hypothetical protein
MTNDETQRLLQYLCASDGNAPKHPAYQAFFEHLENQPTFERDRIFAAWGWFATGWEKLALRNFSNVKDAIDLIKTTRDNEQRGEQAIIRELRGRVDNLVRLDISNQARIDELEAERGKGWARQYLDEVNEARAQTERDEATIRNLRQENETFAKQLADRDFSRLGLPRNRTELREVVQVPVPMILMCPTCSYRHIDEGEFATKPHHTHACQGCGMVWRPAICTTVGVQFLPGFKST